MDILDKARELGNLIKEDERVKNLETVKAVYGKDSELQQAIFEYNVQRSVLEKECEKETPDNEFIESVNKRIKELYDKITTNVNFIEYDEAESALRELMEQIDAIINTAISSETSCSGSCSTCGGCSH